MDKLERMPNIGPLMAAQLREVGVQTPRQLREGGAKQTWPYIQANDPSACYNRLCGLQGAIENIRRHGLADKTKQDLKDFYRQYKKV